MLHGVYDVRLVMFSVALAMLTAYTTLDLAGRVTTAKLQERWLWLIGGAIAMGTGIWSMHFIAMLALSMPISIKYNWLTVFISVLPAIGASGLALYLVSLEELSILRLLSGSLLMGLGISGTHYIGMAAVCLQAKMSYNLGFVGLSIVLAVLISMVALWVGFSLRAKSSLTGYLLKIGSAIILGAAIPSMHYTGMMGTYFSTSELVEFSSVDTTTASWIATIVGLVTLILLGWTLLASFFKEQLSVQLIKTDVLKKNEELLKQALHKQEVLFRLAQSRSKKLEASMLAHKKAQLQLIQSEKMSSLGHLVAGVAHEINNPVSFIYGNVDIAGEYIKNLFQLIEFYQEFYPEPVPKIQAWNETIDIEFLKEDLVKILSSMKVGSERISQIVLSLRNFARLDEAESKKANIHEGINSALSILQNQLKGEGEHPDIEIIKEYSNLPQVDCYPAQLNQVFMSLLANAIDTLKESEIGCLLSECNMLITSNQQSANNNPQIRIATEVLDSNQVRIRFADNGCGMTEKVKQKIFDPFFTTKPVGSGTGLGLSISYQIIVKHGGQLKCISQPCQGTEFQIQIPISSTCVAT